MKKYISALLKDKKFSDEAIAKTIAICKKNQIAFIFKIALTFVFFMLSVILIEYLIFLIMAMAIV